jgi:hypothetical protein
MRELKLGSQKGKKRLPIYIHNCFQVICYVLRSSPKCTTEGPPAIVCLEAEVVRLEAEVVLHDAPKRQHAD